MMFHVKFLPDQIQKEFTESECTVLTLKVTTSRTGLHDKDCSSDGSILISWICLQHVQRQPGKPRNTHLRPACISAQAFQAHPGSYARQLDFSYSKHACIPMHLCLQYPLLHFYSNAGVLLANPENVIKCVGRTSVSYLEENSLLTPYPWYYLLPLSHLFLRNPVKGKAAVFCWDG